MRKMWTAGFLMCIVALLSTLSMPAVSAQPNKPLRCELSISLDWDKFEWVGTVTGDIEGDYTIYPKGATYPGSTEHFFETWKIVTTDGVVIEGFEEGVWSFKTFKFRANGRVTSVIDPSGALSHLVGSNMRIMGTTTAYLGPGVPITGTGILEILPRSHG